MTRWIDDPTEAADSLIESVFDDLALRADQRVLVAYQDGRVPGLLRRRGLRCDVWNRRVARNGDAAAPLPPVGPFDVILLRLPKSKPEQHMAMRMLAERLAPGGRLVVYGGNDEGIKPIATRLADHFGTVALRAARGHGRILEASGLLGTFVATADLSAWAQDGHIQIAGPTRAWRSYPGLFADGALDDATALLLAHLPVVKSNAAVLDYGCGTGVIAAAVLTKEPTVNITLLDSDTVALIAAEHNAGVTDCILGVSLRAAGARRFDLIVSNPPIHVGVREDHTALTALIGDAPTHLHKGGTLVMVVQRRVMLQQPLAAHFAAVDIVAEDTRFRVWRAAEAKRR
jgi:16S rRNA (guanine1207-N2)-methyltransferase